MLIYKKDFDNVRNQEVLMKIKVDRTSTSESKLIFTITVDEPHHSCFGDIEKNIIQILDGCKKDLEETCLDKNKTKIDTIELIDSVKEKMFVRILDNLKFSIENEFRPKFKPICQEIYNWIYDHQTDFLKKWMKEFDPQRTKYYFDNDDACCKNNQYQDDDQDDD